MQSEKIPFSLVILAAGIGSRYGGLKQIDPVGPHGEIVIDYSVYDALQAGCDEVVFVIRRDIETDFRERVGRSIERQVACRYVFQSLDDTPTGYKAPADRKKPWGTAHAIYTARTAVQRPFGVINADDFYGRSSYRHLAHLLATGDATTYGLVAFVLQNTLSDHGSVSRAICDVRQGFLASVVERTAIEKNGDAARYRDGDAWHPLTGREAASMNLWAFHPSFFDRLEASFTWFLGRQGDDPKAEFLIPTVTDELIRSGQARVRVALSQEAWLGVTYPEDKPAVQGGIRTLIDRGVYPAPLWSAPAQPA